MFTGLNGIQIIALLATLIISMGIHEAMHAFAAHSLGDTTAEEEGRLTLNPFKHIDLLTTVALPFVLILLGWPPIFAAKPVPFNPRDLKFEEFGVAIVGLAGPLTNLLLAVIGAVAIHLLGGGITQNLADILFIFVSVNVSFFVFNMIPFPPLDGSRLLYAFAPDWLRDIMERIEALGFMAFLIILIVAIQFIGPLISTWVTTIVNFLI